MRCPFCQHVDTQVIDSRTPEEGDLIRRRRQCTTCQKRFTTYERVELQLPAIVKKNGSRVDYERHKLRASLMLALRKRPVAAQAVDEAIARIEDKLLAGGQREVSAAIVGEMVMLELKLLDEVAYIRFASVYHRFEEVEAFADVINEMLKTQRPTS
ncbi:MAG: transcriptional regulator NrdR [Burkholderiaceae bacterium]